jgi:aryl-alcohol dehydrogenase-like predicted oxidoreductase
LPWGGNPTVYRHQDYVGPENPIEQILEVLGDFVKAGKIRHIGLSNESAWGTMKFVQVSEARGLPRVASVQNAYNLVNRTYETALAEISMREQVGLLAYSPLAQGYLTGKYLNGARPEGSRTTLFNRGQRYEKPGAEIALAKYVALAKDWSLDPAQMALAFVNSRPFLASNIIGATRMEQLKTDIASVNVKLAPELLEQIDAIHQVHMNPCP